MNISGIGVIQAQLLNNRTEQNPLEDLLYTLTGASSTGSSYTLPSEKESIHMEIELKDGTKVSIDYAREGVQKKASYELGRFGNYTYGNDYFSPENTASRILDFAKALWDGSPEKLETLIDAIDKGVSQARKALGSLPSWLDAMIGRTEDLLKKGLDEMKAEASEKAAA